MAFLDGLFGNRSSLLEAEIKDEKKEEDDEVDYTKLNDDDKDPSPDDEPAPDPEENEDDFTSMVGDAEPDAEGDTPEDTGDETEPVEGDEEPEDFTGMVGDAEPDAEGDTPEDTGDETEDFTSMVGDAEPDAEGGTPEDTGDGTEPAEGDDNPKSDEGTSYNKLKAIEDELFADLTQDQILIKNNELKKQFIDLYEVIGSCLIRIKNTDKTEDTAKILKFINEKLLEVRDLVDYNITTAFDTRTYIENSAILQEFIKTLNDISSMIDALNKKPKEDKKSDKDKISPKETKKSEEIIDSILKNDIEKAPVKEMAYFNEYF